MRSDLHGWYSTYVNHNCRCDACTKAWAASQVRRNHQRSQRLLDDPTAAPHGRASTYTNWLCRCDACKSAYRENLHKIRARK